MTDEDWLLPKRTVPVTIHDSQPCCGGIAVIPQPGQGELRELIRRRSVPVFNDDRQGECLHAWDGGTSRVVSCTVHSSAVGEEGSRPVVPGSRCSHPRGRLNGGRHAEATTTT